MFAYVPYLKIFRPVTGNTLIFSFGPKIKHRLQCMIYGKLEFCFTGLLLDWLQFLKQFFINVSYHILVASLTLMAL